MGERVSFILKNVVYAFFRAFSHIFANWTTRFFLKQACYVEFIEESKYLIKNRGQRTQKQVMSKYIGQYRGFLLFFIINDIIKCNDFFGVEGISWWGNNYNIRHPVFIKTIITIQPTTITHAHTLSHYHWFIMLTTDMLLVYEKKYFYYQL